MNIVRSGERSGQFAESMLRLSSLLDATAKLRRKVKSALAYPVVILCMSLGIAAAMIIFVVPIFSQMFADFGHSLPGPTQVLLNISSFITKFWYILLAMARC